MQKITPAANQKAAAKRLAMNERSSRVSSVNAGVRARPYTEGKGTR